MSHIFISHARKDDAIAQKIHDALKARGIESWLDSVDVQSTETWESQVDQALKSTSQCLLVMSHSTLKSPSVAYEYRYCLNEGIPVFVLLVEDMDKRKMPWRLQDTQILDLTKDFDTRSDELAELLKAKDYAAHLLRPARQSGFLPSRSRVTVSMDPSLKGTDLDSFTDLVGKLADIGFKNIQVEAKPNE